MLERARRKRPDLDWIHGDLLGLPFEDDTFDAATVGFGVRNVADLPGFDRGAASRAPSRRPARHPRDHAPRGPLRFFYSLWFDRIVPLLGKVLPAGGVHVPARERSPLSWAG
jgi:demethylmenaquinone methyltransferase/2-methoxy-6-polyprenyl-1,4-benzoquinol methylase